MEGRAHLVEVLRPFEQLSHVELNLARRKLDARILE